MKQLIRISNLDDCGFFFLSSFYMNPLAHQVFKNIGTHDLQVFLIAQVFKIDFLNN